MQPAAKPDSSPSFAGLLAALAAPSKRPDPAWNNDELADDVTSLSYESALRAHARYRATAAPPADSRRSAAGSRAPVEEGAAEEFGVPEKIRGTHPARTRADDSAGLMDGLPTSFRPESPVSVNDESVSGGASPQGGQSQAARLRPLSTPIERGLKSASITIRMSQAECDQLHQRAAEAGLSVSAYLRSCTFEAESLRAMVKEAMAQLRSAAAGQQPAPTSAGPQWRKRMMRLFGPPQGDRRIAGV